MRCRLPRQPLEWIDRSRSVRFHFEGETVEGFAGDTVSSALWASGRKLLGRSFKYHRPRGPMSFANHDVNALFEGDGDTHIRGDVTLVRAGLSLRATNTCGGLAKDTCRWLGLLAGMLPVGFYYKAFHTPRRLFPYWESIIRRAAGLGRVDLQWRRRITPKRYEHADVLVVGAGPAGLQAAAHAAQAGLRVILVDENPHIGGSLDYQWVGDDTAADLREALKAQVTQHPSIAVKTATVAAGYYSDHWLPLAGPQGIAKTRVKAVIVASGLLEQPAVFRNNDLPGVMLMSAAQRLIARYAVRPGQRAVLLVVNEEGYRGAFDLLDAGMEIAAIADPGDPATRGEWSRRAGERGLRILPGYAVYEARGRKALEAVLLAPADSEGRCDLSAAETVACDSLIVSVGWAPAAHLLYQAGGSLAYDDVLEQFVPQSLPAGIYAAGRVNGVFDLAAQCRDGVRAAEAACAFLRGQPEAVDTAGLRARTPHSSAWPVVPHPRGMNFVDFDEDLQLKDLLDAAQEGFDNIELLKRFSTVGMGPSQGKHANMNAIRVLAKVLGRGIDETGSTTARPFYHPQRLDDLAGRRLRVRRTSALHDEHASAGAVFMEAGAWLRPEFYGAAAQRELRVGQEVQAVRKAVGLIDVSTLGKIDVLGPDAARLLDAAYTMRMTTLKEGMTRYALMVDESGVIIDEGIAGCLDARRCYVTTTTSHADSTYRLLSRCVAEWGLDVRLVNRTGQSAAMNLAGPYSRDLLQGMTDIDLDEAAFPYLGIREGRIGDIPARLMRVGFVGELGYEIHVPYDRAAELWQRLMQAGVIYGIQPFGVEAQRRLRLEKGHIIVGQDTDGLTTPFEAAMPWSVHLAKPFFIGRQSLEILKTRTKRTLVGFRLPVGLSSPPVLESHLVIEDGEIRGRVTSVAYSPTLGRVIGMAMVDKAVAERRAPLAIRTTSGAFVEAQQTTLPFYDPDNLRQKVLPAAAEVA